MNEKNIPLRERVKQRKTVPVYRATVELLLPPDVVSESEAADMVAETLRGAGLLDWSYVSTGLDSVAVPVPYTEGDFRKAGGR